MRVEIDQDLCCAAGHCVVAAPDVFDQRDEDGIVVLLRTDVPEEGRGEVEDAVGICPTRAIWIVDE
ncbi:ferredoxin [Aeromicrobium sp.]|jgi:ferredoxin|uniref:ferredoxin n=1 Tax=Aeromicrobium sp. TaxID=1871063 RepID=UPI0025C19B23|nr:ferredoxin [Aeromicrobium sp.]MCK5890277.1 ferredoxin [Aeromicrobium sp.]